MEKGGKHAYNFMECKWHSGYLEKRISGLDEGRITGDFVPTGDQNPIGSIDR
jgi:hypothetical protein